MSTSEVANSIPYSSVIEIEQQTGEQDTRWHPAKRIIFRFIFAYLLLFNLPFPLKALNFTDSLAERYMIDSRRRYKLVLDMEKRNLTLVKRDDPNWKTDFSFTQPEPGLLTMEGTIDEHRIRAKMHRTEPPKFRLTNRGFHWI